MTDLKMPFGTISITQHAKELIGECLASGRVSGGRLVRTLEKRLAKLYGAAEAVAVSSGTDALAVALATAYDRGARRGDEVIVPALSFVATGNAVLHAGFTPVFVDIDPKTLCIDPERIEDAVTGRTVAMIPVHLMGKPADMDAVMDIAARRGLLVVEDAAEAWGALHRDRPVGTIGHMGAFSLYVAHIISTGEGGVVMARDESLGALLRSLRAHGRACDCAECVLNTVSGYCAKRFDGPDRSDIRFAFKRVGFSSKMNELEAALGLGSLDEYDRILAARRANLLAMMEGFKEFEEFLWTYSEAPHERIGPHAFPFAVRPQAPFTRDELMLHLERGGVESRTLFSCIPTQCGGYEFLGHRPGDFPAAERIGTTGIHVGVHQEITPPVVERFLGLVREFIALKTGQGRNA